MNYIEYEVYIQRFGISGEVKINSSFTGIREIFLVQVEKKADTIIRFILEESHNKY